MFLFLESTSRNTIGRYIDDTKIREKRRKDERKRKDKKNERRMKEKRYEKEARLT